MDALGTFLDEHHGVAWVGVLLALPALALNADMTKWWTILGLVSLGVMLGLLVMVFLGRKKSDVICTKCNQTFKLSKERGRLAHCTEHFQLKARRQFQNTVIASLQYDGTLSEETFEYRNHGKRYDANNEWTVLNPRQIFSSPSGLDQAERQFWPPAPIAKGEVFELKRTYLHEDSFPHDVEAVGKRVLFPIQKLTFKVVFEAVEVDSLHGITYYDGRPVAGSLHAISSEKKSDGKTTTATWPIDNAKTGRTYRLSWRWLDTNLS